MTSQWEQRRLKSPAYRLCAQTFLQAPITENIKAPRYWHFRGTAPQRASNAENVSIWWRHHHGGHFSLDTALVYKFQGGWRLYNIDFWSLLWTYLKYPLVINYIWTWKCRYLTRMSSLAVTEMVKMTTSGTVSDENFVKLVFSIQWLLNRRWLFFFRNGNGYGWSIRGGGAGAEG